MEKVATMNEIIQNVVLKEISLFYLNLNSNTTNNFQNGMKIFNEDEFDVQNQGEILTYDKFNAFICNAVSSSFKNLNNQIQNQIDQNRMENYSSDSSKEYDQDKEINDLNEKNDVIDVFDDDEYDDNIEEVDFSYDFQ